MHRASLAFAFLFAVMLGVVWSSCGRDDSMIPKPQPVAVEGNEGAAVFGWAMGPIDGITTAWHPVPAEITVPVGTTLRLKCAGSPGDALQWSNAEEESRDRLGSIAVCRMTAAGRHEISVTVEPNVADRRDRHGRQQATAIVHTCIVNAVDVAPDEIGVTEVVPYVSTVLLAESASNYETMKAFLPGEQNHQQISRLVRLGSDRYVTAINRDITIVAGLTDPRFASLIETRISGDRPRLGLDVVRFDTPGKHSISIGPPGRSRGIIIDTYRVTMTTMDPIQDDVPVHFVAVTDPPGFEEQVTWLSSTKYGEAHPVMGTGPECTITFHSTGTVDSWKGVRADNAALAIDSPTPACFAWSIPYDGLDHRYSADPAGNVFVAAASNVDSVRVVAQTAGLQDIAGSLKTLRPGTVISVHYAQAAYYAIRLPLKPNPVPLASGYIGAGNIPLSCVSPNADSDCPAQTVSPIKSTDVGGLHTVRVQAKNASGASDCPVFLQWSKGQGGANSGSETIKPGESGGFTISNTSGTQLNITYRCSNAPTGKCRATVTTVQEGTVNALAINESWTAQMCGGSSEVIHTGFAPGVYKISISAKSGAVNSDCPVSFSWSSGDQEVGFTIPAGDGPAELAKTVALNQEVRFLVKCNGQTNTTCRVTVNVISTP